MIHQALMTAIALLVIVVCILLPVLLLFVLDDIVLNKHFTKRLHRWLGVEL